MTPKQVKELREVMKETCGEKWRDVWERAMVEAVTIPFFETYGKYISYYKNFKEDIAGGEVPLLYGEGSTEVSAVIENAITKAKSEGEIEEITIYNNRETKEIMQEVGKKVEGWKDATDALSMYFIQAVTIVRNKGDDDLYVTVGLHNIATEESLAFGATFPIVEDRTMSPKEAATTYLVLSCMMKLPLFEER